MEFPTSAYLNFQSETVNQSFPVVRKIYKKLTKEAGSDFTLDDLVSFLLKHKSYIKVMKAYILENPK